MLLYASLVGCSFDLSTLGRLTGLSDGKILTGLDRSTKLGFITESTSDPFTFSFSNPIYREEITRASDVSSKRSAHLRIAADLKDSDSISTRALHLESAGEYDKAIRAYISAAHQSIGRQLPQVALRHLQEAERLRTRDRGEVMIDSEILALDSDLARAYYECGQLEDARARYLRVAALSERTGNTRAIVDCRIKAAVMLRMTQRFDEALAELKGLEKTAEGTDLASVLLEEVDALARISRCKEAKKILRRVERFLDRRPTDATRIRTQYHHRKMLIAVSEQDYAVAAKESRMVVGATKNTSTKWWHHHDLAEAYLFAGGVPSAIQNFEKALILAMDTPSILGEIWTKIGLATANFYALKHRRARDLIEEAEDLARRTEDLNAISNVFLTKARLKLDSMAYDNAEGLIQSAIVLWPGSPMPDYFASLLESAQGNNSIALEIIEKTIDSVKKKKTVLQMISGVLISMDDLVTHRERVRLELGQTDGMLARLAELIPDLYPRARLKLQGVLAEYHVRLGEKALAAKVYNEALSSPDCRYESRERYFMLRQWGKWNREADKKATRMALRMRE